MRRLRDLGEHAWIASLTRRLAPVVRGPYVIVGPGDDAAAVRPGHRPLLLTTDTLAEGVHFRRGWSSAAELGRRAFAVNASDLAAMGGTPTAALLALEAPPRTPAADLDALVRGFVRAANGEGARLVGGNLVAGPHLAVTVALVGEARGRVATRAGARPGDVLYLTGTIGGAGFAVRELAAGRPARWPAVPSRIHAGQLLAQVASAMIDVSDGLLQDLGHLCRASGAAADIDLASLPIASACRAALGARAPLFAATAGEDYELLVAIPARRRSTLERLSRRLGCRLTRVGRVTARRRPVVRLLDAAGRALAPGRGGFDHFRARRGRL